MTIIRKYVAIVLVVIVFVSTFNIMYVERVEAQDNSSDYYDVWDDFENGIWPQTPAGSGISGNYDASMDLTQEIEIGGNKYMKAAGNNSSAWRATEYSLSDEETSGAEVVFDFMPMGTNGESRYGDMMFLSSADNYSYFNITFNQENEIFYYNTPGVNYTTDLYAGVDLDSNPLPNGTNDTRVAALQDTGLQGDGATWFNVKVVFDYANSLADLTITNKSNPSLSYAENGIQIRDAAVNLNRFLLTAFKGQPNYGIDNFGVKYLNDIDPATYYTTYWNDFEAGVWEDTAIGTGIIAEGGSSAATVTQAVYTVDEHYMKLEASSSGSYRVSRLDLPGDALSGADVTFDWMPISAQDSGSRNGDVAFISSGSTYPYFGLQFNKNKEISYYTVGENIAPGWGVTYSEEALEGGIVRSNAFDSGTAASTGITADGDTWYTVELSFDYDHHNADLTIVDRENPGSVLYSADDIPIYDSAYNTAIVAAGGWKGIISMGLDNFGVKYEYSAANSITSVEQPENVIVTAPDWAQHVASRPTTALATMGDGSTQQLAVGEWTSSPAFVEGAYGTYTWTAPLVVPDGILNPKNLALTYTVNYISTYFATGAYDPTSLELDYGSVASVEEMKQLLPEQTYAVLNNGNIVQMNIDSESWEATYTTLQDLGDYEPAQFGSPEFNPEQEGIYVYKAKLKTTGDYEVNTDIWVECRVNYFSYDDNFNGVERAIENLDRGLYAIRNVVYDSSTGTYIDSEQGGIFLSWRILVDEYAKVSEGQHISFDIYRNGTKIDTIQNLTNYLDVDGEVGDTYVIKATQDGDVSFSKEVDALADNYLSIHLQRPLPSYSQTGDFGMYRLNDTEVADVDGDGVYEIIVKWYPNNGFDIGHATTGHMSSPQIIDVYRLDGTALWRLDMGYSSPSSQHTDNFMVYDLDKDGKAEFSILTQDGTRTYKPDENGQFRYVTTDKGGYVFQPDDPNFSESAGQYVLSEDGAGYVLSNAADYDFAYVGDTGSPILDNDYLIDVVGDIDLEGVNMRDDGLKDIGVNEYFTVFNGETGEIIDTIDYKFTSEYMLQTENINLSNRFNIAIANIPADLEDPNPTETIPAVLCERGYYAKATVAAYTLVDGKISLAWDIDTVNEIKGGGNHNMVTGDMDNDGFDELYIGGTSFDHDGTILWAKDGEYNKDFMKHGDMISMTAVFPDSDQLYVFTPVEDCSVSTRLNYALTNAATGARIVGHTFGKADTGRGMLANVTPNPGYELWASTPSGIVDGRKADVLFNAYGEVVNADRPAVQTWNGYWDGDLLSELPDSTPAGGGDKSRLPMGVHKYNWETGETETIASFEGTWTNNSSKNNPNLMADIMGDWREEILTRSIDNEELRIYMTNIPTDYTIYTLMQDSVYRNSVANQNTSYNQPTHTSFYLGEDEVGRDRVLNFDLPTYNYKYTTDLDFSENPMETNVPEEPSDNNTGTVTPPATGGGNNDSAVEVGENGQIVIGDESRDKNNPALTAKLTSDILKKAVEASPDGKLRIRSNGTAVTLDGERMKGLNLDGSLSVTIGTEDAADLPQSLRTQVEEAGAEQVFTLNVTSDDSTIDSVERGSVTVTLPFEREANSESHKIVIYELLEDGSMTPVALSRFDSNSGELIFQPDHLSARYVAIESQTEFDDASGWSQEAVEALAAREIVNGRGNGLFDPQGDVTRAEFTAMLARMFAMRSEQEEVPFIDVEADAWYRDDLAAAFALGIVNGRPDGSFGGNEQITREEMNVLLYRAATLLDMLHASSGAPLTGFTDASHISDYASNAIRQLSEAGLVSGLPDGSFAPKNTATREQASMMLWRLLKQING